MLARDISKIRIHMIIITALFKKRQLIERSHQVVSRRIDRLRVQPLLVPCRPIATKQLVSTDPVHIALTKTRSASDPVGSLYV